MIGVTKYCYGKGYCRYCGVVYTPMWNGRNGYYNGCVAAIIAGAGGNIAGYKNYWVGAAIDMGGGDDYVNDYVTSYDGYTSYYGPGTVHCEGVVVACADYGEKNKDGSSCAVVCYCEAGSGYHNAAEETVSREGSSNEVDSGETSG